MEVRRHHQGAALFVQGQHLEFQHRRGGQLLFGRQREPVPGFDRDEAPEVDLVAHGRVAVMAPALARAHAVG